MKRWCHACQTAHDTPPGCPRSKWGGRKVASVRARIFARDKCVCAECGRRQPPSKLHVDHKTPRAMGGTDHDDNLQTLCASCNLEKGNA